MTELLAQIRANPDDDALRAVYADQLLAAGDPRGELITVELQLESAIGDERAALFQRRAELRAAHAKQWWAIDPWKVYTRRGFPSRVTLMRFLSLPAWLEHEPVDEVQLLLLRTTDLDGLFASRRLAGIRGLILVNAGPRWLDTLIASPLADSLQSLELWSCEYDRMTARPSFDAFPALRRVRCCGLAQSHEWMASWQGLARVETLELPGCRVEGPLLEPLLAARALRAIDISGYPYGEARTKQLIDALARLPTRPTVRAIGCTHDEDVLGPQLESVPFRAPSGEHWRFEREGGELWRVLVDGVPQPIVHYRNNLPQAPAAAAPVGQAVARLAMGGGWCSLGVGDHMLSLVLHARGGTLAEHATIAAGIGGPLRIYDPRANGVMAPMISP